jgi:predicted nucleic acid-binding protein
MTKLYIDTNVIIDLIDDRENEFGENLVEHASRLFTEAILCKYNLILSDWLLVELNKYVIPESIRMLFVLSKKKIIHQKICDEDKIKASQLSPEHSDDALHIVLAEKANADIIVTSNTAHFNNIRTIIPIKKPTYL